MVEFIQQVDETVCESLTASAQVDSENAVIRGVKLIGFESRNRRSYPASTLRAAVQHYEGVRVNLDHPTKPSDPRSIRDRIGVIKGAHFVEGKGIFGDFHYNPKHQAAEQVVWDAQHNPAAVGFSHNASLQVNRKTGRAVVEAIGGVRSMDLVADPATTNGFFESVRDDDPDATEGVIADKIAADEKWRELRRIVDASRSLISNYLYGSEHKSVADARAGITKVATDLISELATLTAPTPQIEGEDMDLKEMTVEQILEQRDDLKTLVQKSGSPTIEELQAKVEQLESEKKDAEFKATVESELSESALTVEQISDPFRKALLETESAEERAALIKDREACFEGQGNNPARKVQKPKTTDATEQTSGGLTPESLAASLRR